MGKVITRAALGSGGLAKEEKLPQPLGRGSVLCIESPYLPRTSLPGKRNTLPGRAAKGGEIQPERKSHADSSASPSCAGCIRRSATVQRAAAGARAGHSRPASSSPLEGAAGGAKPESERAKEHCPSVGTISGRVAGGRLDGGGPTQTPSSQFPSLSLRPAPSQGA
ncbi:hypothetical protein H8959_018107 [Pygathrix nigripes]